MKTKFILVLTLLFAAASVCFAQSVKVTTKKVTYKRGKNAPDYKRSFIVEYPVIAGPQGKKIAAVLNYEKNFDFTIQEEIRELFWLENAGYTVDYNKYGILGVTLIIEGSGAYPSTSIKRLIVNTRNGTRVKPTDVFTNLNGLAALGRVKQQEEIRDETVRLKKDEPDIDPQEYFKDAKFTAENLWAFSVSDEGVTFHYDYGFPHVILALEPAGDYAFTWSELKPFIRRDGLFGRFVK